MNQPSTVEPLETVFEQVEQAKQQWEAAVDALPELICVVDHDGNIIRANRAIEQWTTVPVTKVEGENLHRLLHPNCKKSCYFNAFWQRAKQESSTFKLVDIQKSDAILEKRLSIRARRIGQKKWRDCFNTIVIVHDITKQYTMENTLRENAQRFKALNAISKSILIAQNPNQIAELVLDKLQSLVPFSFATIISYDSNLENIRLLGISEASKRDIGAAHQQGWAQLFSESEEQFKEAFIVSDISSSSSLRDVFKKLTLKDIRSVWNIPLEVESRFIGTMILAHATPDAFSKKHFSTVNEVAKLLTVGLRQAWLRKRLENSNDNLQNMLRANKEQLQTVSHELRSPLGIIKGYTEMLHQGFLGPLTEEQQGVLKILDQKGDQLLHMVQSLFTLQKVDRENLQLCDIEPAAFLQDIVTSWQIIAKNKELKLTLDVEPGLATQHVDKNLLTQVLSNLLDNAVKFSTPGDTITLRARSKTSELLISVQDEGKGIPASEIGHIFQRFYQADKNSSQAKLGAGIGLALCQAIVAAHGGRIWAESDGVNKGSIFSLTLPSTLSNKALSV